MKFPPLFSRLARLCPALAVFTLICRQPVLAAPQQVRLTGHVPRAAIARAHRLGRVASGEKITLALALPPRDPAGLNDLLRRLYDPSNPAYGHFLTPAQFADRFSPTPADYAVVAKFARDSGLTVTGTHASRLVLDVAGPAANVETAFGLHLMRYQNARGRLFRAPDGDPILPAGIAARVAEVVGLDTATVRRPSMKTAAAGIGSGPSGGLSPADFAKAYNLQGVTVTGGGQAIALFELDGYNPSDIAAYETRFGLPAVTLQNVLVDGAVNTAGPNAHEVTLDIELALAAAPGLSRILVYEAPNETDANVLDCYSRIAADNLAKQVCTTWGAAENQTSLATMNAENILFQQMAAQGQSVFAASGDNGAYDDGSTLSVDDPASQPYVTAVGGTTLSLGAGGSDAGETAWGDPTDTTFSLLGSGSGGGFSTIWPVPSYQAGLLPVPSGRSLPDVALNADPQTGYAVYAGGSWHVYGGTSTVVPLWAGLTARVNQARATQGLPAVGFLNPVIYQIGASASYPGDFHDITTGSNLYYPADIGYDNATGWGSPISSALLNTLVNGLPAAPTGTLTGTVTAAGSGSAIPGATVTAASQSGGVSEGATTTDSSGHYTLTVPSGLALDLTVSAYGATGGRYAGAKSADTLAQGQSLTVNFALQPAHLFPQGLQMISAPADYSLVGAFTDLFGPTAAPNAGPHLARWLPALGSYVFAPNAEVATLTPGKGYWANFPAANYLHLDGALVPTSQAYSLALSPGWNQIGDPFPAPLPLSAITVGDGLTSLALPSSPLISPLLYRYDLTTHAYVALDPATDSLQPYVGYWIYARQAVTLSFPPPTGP